MPVSQRCQYALRAVFELSKGDGESPVKMAKIAKKQAIPVRFLEIILNDLKRGGFIRPIRGKDGGWFLARSARELTVGEIMRFIEGPFAPVGCVSDTPSESKDSCPLYGNCVFTPLWERAQKALAEVYDGTTFQDLLDQETQMISNYRSCVDYVI